MKKVRGSYKNSKVIGSYAKSNWVRYRDGRWIPTRKRIFLYWHKFLISCELSDEYEVNWDAYKGWGGSNYILGNKFDTFWEENWKELFSTENRDDEPRYNISTKSPKADAYKMRLKCYELRHLETDVIAKRTGLDWGATYAYGDSSYVVYRNLVNRHLRAAKKHLKNVSQGSFP